MASWGRVENGCPNLRFDFLKLQQETDVWYECQVRVLSNHLCLRYEQTSSSVSNVSQYHPG